TPLASVLRACYPWNSVVVTSILLGGALVYGYWRLQKPEFVPGPRVALLQGNMPQFIRNDEDEWKRMAKHFGELAAQAAEARPDLIVWSETSCFFDWRRIDPACPQDAVTPDWRRDHDTSLSNLYEVIYGHVPALLGLNSVLLGADGKKHTYCSA